MSPKIVRGCGCTICGTTSINANLFGRSPSYNYDRTSRTDSMAKVKVEQGWLAGEQLESKTGTQYYSFKGIPYATPPLGKLRFKAPLPPLPWEGTRDATKHGRSCPQVDIFTEELVLESEDCLYLNVYSPELKPKTPLAVMVFIHGGGYKSGSGDEDNYGPDFLVSHEVVLVTINYRLEAFGFLSLGIPEVPGNAGMKDQVAALKWIKSNIANFGGDPNNVTVFGESAGGASTCLHMISPMSKGLFDRAIPMSGSPLCDWSIAFEPQKRAFTLGKILGFHTTDPYELLNFLQSVPVEKLINTNPAVASFEIVNNNLLKFYHFTPVVEKDFGGEHFLTEEPLTALKDGRVNDVDVLLGYTDNESLIGIKTFESKLIDHYNTYLDVLVPRKIIHENSAKTIVEVADKIHQYYFKGEPITIDKMGEYLKYSNDTALGCDIIRFLRHIPKTPKGKRYSYRFACTSNRNVYGNQGIPYGLTGASHLDDLMYLFDAKKFNIELDKTSREYELVKLACTVFTNFAKYGNPTPDSSLGVIWPEYDNQTESCVEIKDQLTIVHAPEADSMNFWKSIYESVGMEY